MVSRVRSKDKGNSDNESNLQPQLLFRASKMGKSNSMASDNPQEAFEQAAAAEESKNEFGNLSSGALSQSFKSNQDAAQSELEENKFSMHNKLEHRVNSRDVSPGGNDENSIIEDDGRSVGMAASVMGSETISINATTACKVFLMTTNSRYQ